MALTVRGQIHTGELSPGAQMPTELALSEQFGISRGTTRRALAELEKEGLIRIEQGRGIFVADGVISFHIGERVRYNQNLRADGVDPSVTMLTARYEEGEATACRALGLPVGSELLAIEGLGSANNVPLSLGTSYLDARRFQGLEDLYKVNGSFTQSYRSFGIEDYRRQSTSVMGRLPTIREARLLSLPKSRPVLEVQRLDIDQSGNPLSFGMSCFAADRVQFIFD